MEKKKIQASLTFAKAAVSSFPRRRGSKVQIGFKFQSPLPVQWSAGPPRPRRPGQPRGVTRGARPVGRGAGRGEPAAGRGQVETGPEKSPGMGMGLRRGLRAAVAISRMNRGGGIKRRSWDGKGAPGGPHPVRGAATQDHEGSELLRPRLAAHPRSERAQGRGRTGRGAEEWAGGHPPVPPGRSAGGGGRSLGRMAGRFLKIWG